MNLDTQIAKSLNAWGAHHSTLVRFCSNDLVYILLAAVVSWFVIQTLTSNFPNNSPWKSLLNGSMKGLHIFAAPTGIAVVISEVASRIYVRNRPFVSVPGVRLLAPHAADGGMPSHHMVFMASLVASVYFYNRSFSLFLASLTLVSGLARVVAGIHYPSDIIAGVGLGFAVTYGYRMLRGFETTSRNQIRSS